MQKGSLDYRNVLQTKKKWFFQELSTERFFEEPKMVLLRHRCKRPLLEPLFFYVSIAQNIIKMLFSPIKMVLLGTVHWKVLWGTKNGSSMASLQKSHFWNRYFLMFPLHKPLWRCCSHQIKIVILGTVHLKVLWGTKNGSSMASLQKSHFWNHYFLMFPLHKTLLKCCSHQIKMLLLGTVHWKVL